MANHLETEFKLRTPRPIEVALVDAAVRESAFTCSASASHRHSDIYLDDAQRSLAASGIGLRIRIDRGKSTITCKSQGQRTGALFVRAEQDAPWPSPTTPPTAADLPATLRDAIEPVVLRRPLVPVLRLDVARDLRQLSFDDHELCELAIDRVQAHGAGRSIQFTEIELEVIDDLPSCEKLAEHLERELHVEAAASDKPTHAATLLGLARSNGLPDVDSEAPASTAIEPILRRQIMAIQRAETQVRQSLESEPVHAMRIALRRLRAVVSAFRQLWPEDEGRWIRAHLRALATELGRVRDLDVMVERLPEDIGRLPPDLQPGAERALDWLRTACRQAHADLGAWLRSSQRLGDTQRFGDLIFEFAPELGAGEPSIAVATRASLDEQIARVRQRTKKLTEDAAIGDYHAARIAGKRLRYLLEELADFAPPLPGKPRKRLSRLQRALGTLCDCDTAVRELLGWEPKIRADCVDEPRIGPAVGALAQLQFAAAANWRPRALASARRIRRDLRLQS